MNGKEITLKPYLQKQRTSEHDYVTVECKICKSRYFAPSGAFTEEAQVICSDFCEEKIKEDFKRELLIEREKEVEENIERIIPKKFQSIETDRRKLFSEIMSGAGVEIKIRIPKFNMGRSKRFDRRYTEPEVETRDHKYGQSFFISGSPGIGKSVFLVSVMREHLRRGLPVRFVSFPALISDFQGSFSTSNRYGVLDDKPAGPYEQAQKLAEFTGALFIDDLGAEKSSEFVRMITFRIFNGREMNELPTFITSNLGLDEIGKQLGTRISSRVAGMCRVLKFSGTDRRFSTK